MFSNQSSVIQDQSPVAVFCRLTINRNNKKKKKSSSKPIKNSKQHSGSEAVISWCNYDCRSFWCSFTLTKCDIRSASDCNSKKKKKNTKKTKKLFFSTQLKGKFQGREHVTLHMQYITALINLSTKNAELSTQKSDHPSACYFATQKFTPTTDLPEIWMSSKGNTAKI